jgi:hypothetical protein
LVFEALPLAILGEKQPEFPHWDRRAKFISFQRAKVVRNDKNFAATKQMKISIPLKGGLK